MLRQPELADDERFSTNSLRVTHRAELAAAIGRVFRALTADEILARLEAAQIASARMNSVQEFVEHPQLATRDRWREIGSPSGPIRALSPPASFEGLAPAMGAVPALGEHSDRILRELGFDEATIARWREERMI